MIILARRFTLLGLLMFIYSTLPAKAANDPVPNIVIQAANLNLGFDPPIDNDRHTTNVPYDQENAEWWTIVARTDGTVTIPGGTEKYIKNVNTNIHVKFLDGINPADYKVRPKAGSADYIGVVNNNGGGEVMQADTTLKITGKNTSGLDIPAVAEVEIYSDFPGKKSKYLKVHVMKVRKIVLGVYFVKAPTSAQTEPPAAFRTSATIIQRLNEIYRQACIEFELSSDSSDNLTTYNYDILPQPTPNLKLDVTWNLGGYGHEGNRIFDFVQLGGFQTPPGQKLSLIIVRDLLKTPLPEGQPQPVGITPGYVGDEIIVPTRCVVETKDFEPRPPDPNIPNDPGTPINLEGFYLTCAHEIGHALGLCTRSDGVSVRHDPGKFPSSQYNLDGTPATNGQAPRMDGSLMRKDLGGWKWIRHEDWYQANRLGSRFVIPLP